MVFVILSGCGFIDFSREAIDFLTKLSSRLSRLAVEPNSGFPTTLLS
jgi:hypothetical protein